MGRLPFFTGCGERQAFLIPGLMVWRIKKFTSIFFCHGKICNKRDIGEEALVSSKQTERIHQKMISRSNEAEEIVRQARARM